MAIAASAYLPPVAERDGVIVRIAGFEEETGGPKLKVATRKADEPVSIPIIVENRRDEAVSGRMAVWLNDDWEVAGVAAQDIVLQPHSTNTVTATATAKKGRALSALYPIHATFAIPGGEPLHPIAVFRAEASCEPKKPKREDARAAANGDGKPTEEEWRELEEAAVLSAQKALAGGTDAARERFRLSARGETWGAAWAFGKMGAFDGVLAFTDGTRTLLYRGFACDVDEIAVGGVGSAEVRAVDGDAVEVVHAVERDGRSLPLRLRMWPEKGALRMRWDMPGTVRDARGHPRYTRLGLGNCSLPAWRAYAGFGNVIENPKRFTLKAGGFNLSTRHVGGDYANGLSLLQATDVFPDRLECDRDQKRYSIETHHDATFSLVPSVRGAFAAARAFRDVCGYRKSPALQTAAVRMCIDQWGGDYAETAKDLERAGRYGLNESFFVKHVWQRWGYDYRLPDIYPPNGDNVEFMAMRAAAKKAGILFCPHDNYIDFYPDAHGYSYDRIVFNRDGTPMPAWYNQGRRAQSYRWAPHAFMPWLEVNAATLRNAFAPDGVFIDVFTAIAPFDYYDREGRFHTKVRTQEAWGRAFDRYRDILGDAAGVMVSEAGTDALVGHLDAGQSDHFGAERWMETTQFDDSERVPWHDMATHGSFVLLAGGLGHRYSATAWNRPGDRRLHGYGSDDYLCNTVIGGRTPMCDGPFSRRTVMTYWLLHDICRSLALADFESLEYGDTIHQQHSRFSNGGEAWINRATNGVDWTVGGHVLPPYGFYAAAPGVRAGVTRIGGQRCAFAAAQGCLFVDARPPHDDGVHVVAASRAVSAEIVGPAQVRIATEWTMLEPMSAAYRPFVHVVPADGRETPILFHCAIDLPDGALAGVGTRKADIDVRLPKKTKAGRYDVRYGMFRPDNGGRLRMRGIVDGCERIKGGTLTVEKTDGAFVRLEWSPPAENDSRLELNDSHRIVDFAGVKTDGAFRLEHPASGDWRLTPLPGSRPFRVLIDLSALGATGGTVSSVTAIDAEPDAQLVTWRQLGQSLDIRVDARAFAYRIVFEKK